MRKTLGGGIKQLKESKILFLCRAVVEDEEKMMSSALPLVLLRWQLSCSLQVFVDEFFLCGGQAGLISAVLHGVLSFPLNKQ